jgi:hypothetical protein
MLYQHLLMMKTNSSAQKFTQAHFAVESVVGKALITSEGGSEEGNGHLEQ